MAPKDYVTRPQAKKQVKKRPVRKARGKAEAAPSAVSWMKVVIALLIIGLFIVGLYRLQTLDSSPEEVLSEKSTLESDLAQGAQQNEQSLEVAQETELEVLAPLPVLGDEEWEYIDSLPEYSVEVDATGPLQSDKDVIMQCGSFRTPQRADELRAKIALQGLESRVLTSNGETGLWYRVVLGPYERKRNAERHRHQLRQGKINGCKIW